jgi:hypothetical protein
MFKKKGINTTMTYYLMYYINQLLLKPEVYNNKMLLLFVGIRYTLDY